MTAEFVFLMGIAATCFSWLLFTLWTLGSEKWTSGPLLGSWCKFGLETLNCRLAKRRLSTHASFTTVLYTGCLRPSYSFRAYLNGRIRRFKQHASPHQ